MSPFCEVGKSKENFYTPKYFFTLPILNKPAQMNLVIDWGNTHCKWAVFKDATLVHTHIEKTSDLAGLKEYLGASAAPKAVLLSSVVNIKEETLHFLRENFKLLELSTHTKLPIKNL